MAEFDELLQSAERLASELGSGYDGAAGMGGNGAVATHQSDHPRVERNLMQLMDAGQQLFNKTNKESGAGIHLGSQDVKASVLLGSKGVDLPTMTNALEALAATASAGSGFQPIDRVARDTDVAGFLKSERENAILSVVEETRTETFEAADKLHWESTLAEWNVTKNRILDELSGSDDVVAGSIARGSHVIVHTSRIHDKTARTSSLDRLEMMYAERAAAYNDAAAKGGLKPDPVEMFKLPFTEDKEHEAYVIWSMVSAMADLQPPAPLQSKDVISRSKKYLEQSFLKHVQSIVFSNLRQAELGGIPGTLPLIKSYLNVKLATSSSGLEDGQVWPTVYFCLRCGDFDAAAEACAEAGPGLIEMSKLLLEIKSMSDGRLTPHAENVVRITYKRTVRHATDPYKRAVYCILGACDPADEHAEVATSLDDYLWVKISQIRQPAAATTTMDNNEEADGDCLVLEKLQRIMSQDYGESHFNAFEQPVLYFQVLFLTGQFEAAVDFLFRVERFRPHGVHVGLSLFEKNLIRLPPSIQEPLLSEAKQLNVARMVMLYVRKFEGSDPKEALNYFYFLRGMESPNRNAVGSNFFTTCVSELVLESREFDLLLGKILPDGSRLPGLIDKYQDDLNGTVNVLKVIQAVAEDLERKGIFEDAARLYDLAKMHEKVVEILNKLLAQVVMQPNVAESRRDRLHRQAVEVAKRYSSLGHGASKDPTATFFVLLDLMTFFDAFHANKFNDALNIVAKIKLVPLAHEEIDASVSTFRLLQDELRRNVPDVLLATMNILFINYKNFKVAMANSHVTGGSHDGGREKKLLHLREQAKALITFAGMIPYRMPGDTNARLVQMEVLMN